MKNKYYLAKDNPTREAETGKKVLIVGNNELTNETLFNAFTLQQYKPISVNKYFEAVMAFSSTKFRIVIIDAEIQNFLGLIQSLKKLNEYAYFILIGNSKEDIRTQLAFSNGVNDFISRPFRIEEIYTAISRFDYASLVKSKLNSSKVSPISTIYSWLFNWQKWRKDAIIFILMTATMFMTIFFVLSKQQEIRLQNLNDDSEPLSDNDQMKKEIIDAIKKEMNKLPHR